MTGNYRSLCWGYNGERNPDTRRRECLMKTPSLHRKPSQASSVSPVTPPTSLIEGIAACYAALFSSARWFIQGTCSLGVDFDCCVLVVSHDQVVAHTAVCQLTPSQFFSVAALVGEQVLGTFGGGKPSLERGSPRHSESEGVNMEAGAHFYKQVQRLGRAQCDRLHVN